MQVFMVLSFTCLFIHFCSYLFLLLQFRPMSFREVFILFGKQGGVYVSNKCVLVYFFPLLFFIFIFSTLLLKKTRCSRHKSFLKSFNFFKGVFLLFNFFAFHKRTSSGEERVFSKISVYHSFLLERTLIFESVPHRYRNSIRTFFEKKKSFKTSLFGQISD